MFYLNIGKRREDIITRMCNITTVRIEIGRVLIIQGGIRRMSNGSRRRRRRDNHFISRRYLLLDEALDACAKST